MVTEKELNHFTYKKTKTRDLAKSYQLLKMYLVLQVDQLFNCGTTTEKASELLNFYVNPGMRNGKSYIKEYSDFINKIKSIYSLPRDAIIAKVDTLGLYLFTCLLLIKLD